MLEDEDLTRALSREGILMRAGLLVSPEGDELIP